MAAPALTQADASVAGAWWRPLVPLGCVTALVGLTGAFVIPFLPVFLSQQVRASPLESSLFLFLSPIAGIAVSHVTGRISDRPGGRPRVIIVAAVCGLAGFALYALSRQYWILLAVSLTLVAVGSAIVPQIYALGRELVERVDPSRVTIGINALRMMMSAAWAAGAPLGAFVLGLIDFNGLFLATSMMHFAVLAVMVTIRGTAFQSTTTPTAKPEAAGRTDPEEQSDAALPSRARIVATTVGFTFLSAVTALTVTTMPLFVSVELQGDLTSAGVVLGLCATIEIPLMLVFGAMANRWSLHRLILVGGGFGVAYCLAGSLSTSVWQVAAAQVLHACFVCCTGGLGITYFQELMPTALGRATSLFSNAARFAGMFAGLGFGLVQVLGYRSAYIGSLGLAVTGTAVLAVTGRRHVRVAS